ncbi:MAG TPA: hypothetical protein VN661_08995 [Candidatus Acidoferrales bacterium]|nr:hypothetical protein [Candidatus Acidoferrales bacterium]
MKLPESWTERLPFLSELDREWDRVPPAMGIAALVCYLAFLYQEMRGTGFLLMMDLVFVPVHEGGHLLFRFFGEFISVAGGTGLQLGVPLALCVYFVFQRKAQGAAFCAFFFFEQFLPISVYMADARAEELPLLTVGDSGYVIHDWNYLFGSLGVLNHNIQIAHAVRAMGWLGMMGTVGWLAWRCAKAAGQPPVNPRRETAQ